MPGDDVASRLQSVPMPEYYRKYYGSLADYTSDAFEAAALAKSRLVDSSVTVEPKIVYDLADRVAKMHDIDIAEPLRELLGSRGKEISALAMAKNLAQGMYQPQDATLEQRLDLAVRVGLAIVTEGVTIAPLQGISQVTIKKNKDGTDYLSVSIAGPMRSAGGTESAVTMLIADYARQVVGLGRYQANSFDDEVGRFIEELRIYEREASSFQFHIVDEDIKHVISHLPVELDGVDTDPYEVVNHKSMARIKTDRVRGGALRVLNDGLVGRSKKLLKRIEMYNLEGWEWLKDLEGAVQTGENKEDAASKRMREVITGRSVLSMSNRTGGFRLRYGRACNTGFAAVGIHPAVAEILDYTVVVGTQIKTDIPGKGATIALVDSIDPPTVLLVDGSVVRIRDLEHAVRIKGDIQRILYLGDILVSFGDFLENNAHLVPSGYVEEFWQADLAAKIAECSADDAVRLRRFLTHIPAVDEALELSSRFGMPLHPHHLFFWDLVGAEDLARLTKPKSADGSTIRYAGELKPILERLGVPHRMEGEYAVLDGNEAKIFAALLLDRTAAADIPAGAPAPEILSGLSGVEIRPKFSCSVGVRIGRPEKAAARHMKPPSHILFPVGERGGPMRDLAKASKTDAFYTSIQHRRCAACGRHTIGFLCDMCGSKTAVVYHCMSCRDSLAEPFCDRCHRPAVAYSHLPFPLKERLALAQERMEIRMQEPLKGVKDLIGLNKIPEPFEKGLARQNFGLAVFKDGTVRFDATNSPLTHFRPSWINTPVSRLVDLGYTHDMDGNPLESPDQTVEMRMQDVILPYESCIYLVSACKFIDTLLQKFYKTDPFYAVKGLQDLVGHLVVGLAPHTSVGIVGRIIGFTKTQVCFATPNWHSAKRRDADGDADSVMLLMDALLNFSRRFLSDRIGGLMDAPLLVQPLVMPYESQPQAHNLEAVRSFPLEFFKSTLQRPRATDISSVEIIKSRLDTDQQFYDYLFTHQTSSIVTSKQRSAYSTLNSMLDKFDMQMRNADMIDAVDAKEIVTSVISTHLVPDIMGNLRAYARQKFRCTDCSKSYRRIPLTRKCTCGHVLIPTITRPSVEKYLTLAKRLVAKYDVGEYHRNRIHALSDEIDMVFGKSRGAQSLLSDFAQATAT